MRKAIVTGGAGFIGSHLCEYLIENGDKVICIDNLITGGTTNLERIWKHKNFEFIEHNISEPFYTGAKIDYIYHLASPASPKDYLEHPIHTLKVGALGTYHMLGLAKHHGARFLLASTSEVYGDPKISPQSEGYWGNVNPIGPRGVYDEAKRYAEAITMAYHRSHNVDTRIARIFNTFGPRMRLDDGRAVPNFIGQALRGDPITVYGDGTQTRSFCFISDLVEAIYRLMMSDYNLPMNLGNPEELTILEFAKLIKQLCESDSEIVYEQLPQDDPMQRRPDIRKAKEILGYKPKLGLEEGLKRTIRYFRENIEITRE
jgi:dTDP-glucose 4,6-dehydratase